MNNNIRKFRESKNLFLEQMAPLVNMTTSKLSRLETGKTSVIIEDAEILADFFAVSLDELFGRQPSPGFQKDKIVYKEKDLSYSSIITNLYKFSKDELLKISGAVDSMLERRSEEPSNQQKEKNYLDKFANDKN